MSSPAVAAVVATQKVRGSSFLTCVHFSALWLMLASTGSGSTPLNILMRSVIVGLPGGVGNFLLFSTASRRMCCAHVVNPVAAFRVQGLPLAAVAAH
jgi:hypothetical protein